MSLSIPVVGQKRYSWYLFLQTCFEGTFIPRKHLGVGKRETHSIPALTHCTKHHLFSKRSMILSSTINLIHLIHSYSLSKTPRLGRGFKYFLFSPLFGEQIPILTFAYFSKGLVKNHQPVISCQKTPRFAVCFFPTHFCCLVTVVS